MNEPHTKRTLKTTVMDAISSGKVRMRPRWKFILSGAGMAFGILVLFFALLYVTSFGIFMLRQSGALFVPIFGFGGVLAFLAALPLAVIAVLLVFLVALEAMVRRYRVGYRTPLLLSLLAFLVLALVGGYALGETRIHAALLHRARIPGALPPPIAAIYRGGSEHIPGIYRGTIISMFPGGFLLADENGAGTTTILLDPSTRLPFGAGFNVGHEVVVFGENASGSVRAIGVREIQR